MGSADCDPTAATAAPTATPPGPPNYSTCEGPPPALVASHFLPLSIDQLIASLPKMVMVRARTEPDGSRRFFRPDGGFVIHANLD